MVSSDRPSMRRRVLPPALADFLEKESAGGIILMIAAALAMVVANSALLDDYEALLGFKIAVGIDPVRIDKPLLLWINDGLMALFFLLIGLEVKREIREGELSSLSEAALPIGAAIGGMAVPALIFVAINGGNAENLRGWAIPAATDIAFALGILALLGSRVPAALKTLLLAIAIIDDIGAIVIIALFYTADLALLPLGLAVVATVGLFVLNRMKVMSVWPYLLVGAVLWVCVLKSGIHATLAGVVTAFAIPIGDQERCPLKGLEHAMHPWIAFLVLPIFGFANAGVSLAGVGFADLLAPLPLGIALGLFAGKQIGILGAAWAMMKLRWALPSETITWRQVWGLACIAGIGFTMSLFIGGLAMPEAERLAQVKLGVLAGSLLSAVTGFLILRQAAAQPVPVAR